MAIVPNALQAMAEPLESPQERTRVPPAVACPGVGPGAGRGEIPAAYVTRNSARQPPLVQIDAKLGRRRNRNKQRGTYDERGPCHCRARLPGFPVCRLRNVIE